MKVEIEQVEAELAEVDKMMKIVDPDGFFTGKHITEAVVSSIHAISEPESSNKITLARGGQQDTPSYKVVLDFVNFYPL